MKYSAKSDRNGLGCQDDGFTMLELIIAIVIIGIVGSIAVTKFNDLTDNANIARCDANRGAIASSVAVVYADTLVQDPTADDWLANTNMSDVQADWFATGAVPVCPVGGTFT